MPPEDNSQLTPSDTQVPEAPLTPPVQMSSEPTPPALKQIRTFQGDVAGALERQNESLFSIQQIEQLKRASGGTVPEVSEPDNSGKRREYFFLIIGSIFFVGLGVVGAWYGYQEYLRKTAPPVVIAPESRLISIQESVDIDATGITREALLTKISEESSSTKKGIKHLVLRRGVEATAPLVSTTELLQTLKVQAPGALVRSFDPIFMLGNLGDEGGGRFLIIKLSSFDNAFAGMLTWEKTLGQDLGVIFSTNTEIQEVETGATFKDVIYTNKDVRVLSAGTGTSTKPVLMYSFFDNKMLIITENLETLQTIIDRLTQALLVH